MAKPKGSARKASTAAKGGRKSAAKGGAKKGGRGAASASKSA